MKAESSFFIGSQLWRRIKSPPIRKPLIAKSAYLALIVLILYVSHPTEPLAQSQPNPQQAPPNVSPERTGEAEKPDQWTDLSKILDPIEKLTTILALTLGGIGAYYKFFKGRTFHHRLQPDVSGKLVVDGEVRCLLVTMQLRNVGVSSVYLTEKGTRVDVYSYRAESYMPIPHLARWNDLETFPIFKDHKWIESGEAIKDALLIPIPAERQVAFKVEMTVNCHGVSFRSKAIIEGKQDTQDKPHGKDE